MSRRLHPIAVSLLELTDQVATSPLACAVSALGTRLRIRRPANLLTPRRLVNPLSSSKFKFLSVHRTKMRSDHVQATKAHRRHTKQQHRTPKPKFLDDVEVILLQPKHPSSGQLKPVAWEKGVDGDDTPVLATQYSYTTRTLKPYDSYRYSHLYNERRLLKKTVSSGRTHHGATGPNMGRCSSSNHSHSFIYRPSCALRYTATFLFARNQPVLPTTNTTLSATTCVSQTTTILRCGYCVHAGKSATRAARYSTARIRSSSHIDAKSFRFFCSCRKNILGGSRHSLWLCLSDGRWILTISIVSRYEMLLSSTFASTGLSHITPVTWVTSSLGWCLTSLPRLRVCGDWICLYRTTPFQRQPVSQ